jgi:hypothetical protein
MLGHLSLFEFGYPKSQVMIMLVGEYASSTVHIQIWISKIVNNDCMGQCLCWDTCPYSNLDIQIRN